jgi:hypothetical protein
MLDGERHDSTVGTVEIRRDVELDIYECVIFFTSSCDCGWEGERRDNDECTSSEACAAMVAEAEEHMRTSHPSVRVGA